MVDLQPKVLLSHCDYISTLIRGGLHRYIEYKNLEEVVREKDGEYTRVPSGRADIFKDRSLSLGQKRCLMKLVKVLGSLVPKADDGTGYAAVDRAALREVAGEAVSFDDFLASFGLDDEVRILIRHSIAFETAGLDGETDSDTVSCLARLVACIRSTGVYGPQPFLVPLYGAGEYAQAWCRLGAVYGGVFILREQPTHLLVEQNAETGKGEAVGVAVASGTRYTARRGVVAAEACVPSHLRTPPPPSLQAVSRTGLVRAVICSRGPLLRPNAASAEGAAAASGVAEAGSAFTGRPENGLLLAVLHHDSLVVHALQVDPSLQTSRNGIFVLHLTAAAPTADADAGLLLGPLADQIAAAAPTDSTVEWRTFFGIGSPDAGTDANSLPGRFMTLPVPEAVFSLDPSLDLVAASHVFSQMVPDGTPFVAAVPNPEDVVFGEEEKTDETPATTTTTTS
jgi:hypothetical protein